MPRRTYVVISISLLVIGLVGMAVKFMASRHRPSNPSQPLVSQVALDSLPHKSASTADLSHLASGLLPPTNMWLSGMALQKTPQPVYPLPLSFRPQNSGFSIGLPTISSASDIISGEHVAGISASLGGSNSFVLSRYDKLSATLTYKNKNGQAIGLLTVAEGSPYVFYRASQNSSLTLSGINPTQVSSHTAQYLRYSMNGHDYVTLTNGKGSSITVNGSVATIQAPKGSLVTFYALPGATTADSLKPFAGNELAGVTTTYQMVGENALTTFRYHTQNGQATLFAALPYQHLTNGHNVGVSYGSMYGSMQLVQGKDFVVSTAAMAPSDKLDLSHLTPTQKSQLTASLQADIGATTIDKTDSYYAGKQLARAANLLSVAEQLQQPAAIRQLKNILNNAFAVRLAPSYWYYDTSLKGIAAQNPSFGSQDFNDHQFHYGYFIYAASILGTYDPSFVSTYKDEVNLLVADIASYKATSQFPFDRTFDPYAGHSWAAGLAPFADGNNQESSSEAIQAWNGVALWGKLTKNQTLQQNGLWMLANEAHAAGSIWRQVGTTTPATANYTSPLVDINFGGKRVYSTFFTNEPGAKLGIQLIPFNPAFVSFASDGGSTINRLLNASIVNNNYNVALGDYDLMYLALTNPSKAASLAAAQTNIDDGNSRTYLQAWIFSQLDK